MKTYWSSLAVLLAFLGTTKICQGQEIVRPFVVVGYLMAAPSAADLGYWNESTWGGGSYSTFTINRAVYGGGMQMLFDLPSDAVSSRKLRIGFDLGWQKLYSSIFDPGEVNGVDIFVANFTDEENAMHVLGLVEYAPSDQPFFLQGGAGLHIDWWSNTHTFDGTYESNNTTNGSTTTHFGLEVAGGMNAFSAGNVTFPVLLRIDYLFMYGSTLTGNVMAGVDFKF